MLIENYLQNPEFSYVYLERYVNKGSPSGFSSISTSPKTSPRSKALDFELYEVLLPNSIICENIGNNNLTLLAANSTIVHPDMYDELVVRKSSTEIINKIKVFPTSSGRTVKVAGEDFFIKLTYTKLLGRTDRQIAKKHVLAALEISSEIARMIDDSKISDKTALLREIFGRVAWLPAEKDSMYEWGYIFREFTPYPKLKEEEYLLPCFSLFSKDIYAPNDLPLLIQLFQKQPKGPVAFILEDLIFPIYESFFSILNTCGIGLEAHAQNTLVTFGRDFKLKRIVFRDLESAYRDLPLRKFLGEDFSVEANGYKVINSTDYNYGIMHSFMFDFKLGEYLISEILNCLNSYYPINIDSVCKIIQEYNKQYIALLPANYFPNKWFDYNNEIFEGNKVRPYIPHENPKYRAVK